MAIKASTRSYLFVFLVSMLALPGGCGGGDGNDSSSKSGNDAGNGSGDGTVEEQLITSAVLGADGSSVEVFTYDESGQNVLILDGTIDPATEQLASVSHLFVIDRTSDLYQRIDFDADGNPASLYDRQSDQTLAFSNFGVATDVPYYKLDVTVRQGDGTDGAVVDSYEYLFDGDKMPYRQYFGLFQNPSALPALTGITDATNPDISASLKTLRYGAVYNQRYLSSQAVKGLKAAGWAMGVTAGVVGCSIAAAGTLGAAAVACGGLAYTVLQAPCTFSSCLSDSMEGYCDWLNVGGLGASTVSCASSLGNPGNLVSCGVDTVGALIGLVPESDPGQRCAAEDPSSPNYLYTINNCDSCSASAASKFDGVEEGSFALSLGM